MHGIMMSLRYHIIDFFTYTLKTGISVEEGDCILKLLRRVSRPEIQLGVAFHSELLTFSLRKLSTSSFILNFSECSIHV